MKHTSGPWKVVNKSYSGVGILEGLPSIQVADDGLTIAQLCDTGNEQADAYLIAAAPELLEALQEMVSEIAFLYLEHAPLAKKYRPQDELVLERLQVVIAKATGEG